MKINTTRQLRAKLGRKIKKTENYHNISTNFIINEKVHAKLQGSAEHSLNTTAPA